MSQVLVAATGRTHGSRPAGRLRRSGSVPGVLYGLGLQTTSLEVDWPSLRRALNDGGAAAAPVNLRVDGVDHVTIIKEIQRHPVRRDVLHVDFMAIDPDATLRSVLPVILTGTEELSPSTLARLEVVRATLEVDAKPAVMPLEIPIAAETVLAAGVVRVRDLQMPAGSVIVADGATVVATAGASDGDADGDDEA